MAMHCNTCRASLRVGFSCTICGDFNLCTDCFDKIGHMHEVKALIVMSPEAQFSKDQLHGCALQLQQDPVHCFIKDLHRVYQNRNKDRPGAGQFIFDHFSETNLVCNCIFCKRMLLMFKYHSKKCQVPQCPLENCPIIDERLFKRRLTGEANDVVMQKLMKIRFIMKNNVTQATGATPDETDPLKRSLALNRKFMIQRCIRTLVHACHCVETNCMPASCQKMKRILTHIKICKRKINGGCIICKQLCTLCCYHAKSCHEAKCSVLLCSYIKRKLRDSKLAAIRRRCRG